MRVLLDCCCGLDVHKDVIQACILRGDDDNRKVTRETFGAIRSELRRLCGWLRQNDCRHIAMESTGVYWQLIYDCIEEEYPEKEALLVVNAHHIFNLPGRKSDVKDAEWIAQLLQCGLLSNSYIPEKRIRILREMSRMKRSCINDHTAYCNRLEKFLQTHGFKLSSVVSDILGVAGRNMLELLARKGSLTPTDV
jgi:transposase